MNATTRAGLGRGLAALIPSAEQLERRSYSPAQRLLDRLVNAGFDLLQDGNNLGICAYLHVPHDDEPYLFLRTPALDSLTPTRAFRLVHGIAMATNLAGDENSFECDHLEARSIRTYGPASDGLHIVARSRGRFDYGSTQIVGEICRSFGELAHQVQAGSSLSSPTSRLVVTRGPEDTAIEVVVSDGPVSHIGRGRASDPPTAVSHAMIDAIGAGYRHIDTRILPIDGHRAVLVVLRDPSGELRLGVTMATDDILQAAADAAARAILSGRGSRGR